MIDSHKQYAQVVAGGLCALCLLALWLWGASSPVYATAAPAGASGWPIIELLKVPGALNQPVHIDHAGDGSNRLFVVEKAGRVRIFKDGVLVETPFLDIRDRVNNSCNECGLLSIAFPPNYEEAGHFFVYYNSQTSRIGPDPSGLALENPEPDGQNDSVIARFRVTGNPDVADPESEEVILLHNQPYGNHNGGLLAFGPDGYLYIGLGDGGSGNDPHNAGQRTGTLLGKLLRIEVGASGTYTAPAGNPFVGDGAYRPEIWALGLRNPWRFSFDSETGDLYIADVGQNAFEEVNFQPTGSSGGENYGWRVMEGPECVEENCEPTAYELPVYTYPHEGSGCSGSVTGGMVYRGPDRGMQGIYLFGDYCKGWIRGLQHRGEQWEHQTLLETELRIAAFGADEVGNLYVADHAGAIYRIESRDSMLYLPVINYAVKE
jgi:glucose/arabinose dehydrogenase